MADSASSTPEPSAADAKPPEPGSAESLGLTKKVPPASTDDAAAKIEEKGEPFDDNFA